LCALGMNVVFQVQVLSMGAIPIEANRNCGRVADRGKEAEIEPMGRWTRIAYEVVPSGASEQEIAKLRWSRLWERKRGGRVGMDKGLTRGYLALRLKGRRQRRVAGQARTRFKGYTTIKNPTFNFLPGRIVCYAWYLRLFRMFQGRRGSSSKRIL
jgi:hypothetical protein